MLKTALQFFDKEHMRLVADCSSKLSNTLRVNGYCHAKVPRKSVYDTELMRILTNWLTEEAYEVTGQWHVRDNSNDKYNDIVIKKSREPTLVLELLATGDPGFIRNHIEKTPHYLRAQKVWVIHFTCEDRYLQNPYWQSDNLLNKAIYMAHFWHNRDFTEVRMSARWKENGIMKQVDNEQVF